MDGENDQDDPDWSFSDDSVSDDCDTGVEFEITDNCVNSDHIHERKFVVFESCLRQLFLLCFFCACRRVGFSLKGCLVSMWPLSRGAGMVISMCGVASLFME